LRASLVKRTTFLLVALTQIVAAAHQPKAIAPEIVVVDRWETDVFKFLEANVR
jgi:hypothetical protein